MRYKDNDYVKIEILVLSRGEAERYKPIEPTICISITDSEETQAEFNHSFVDILRLSFLDLEDPIPGLKDTAIFTNKDADDILEFVNKHKDDVKNIMVHCEAGISRSAGVAAALAKILNGHRDQFYTDEYYPNELVETTILKRAAFHRDK